MSGAKRGKNAKNGSMRTSEIPGNPVWMGGESKIIIPSDPLKEQIAADKAEREQEAKAKEYIDLAKAKQQETEERLEKLELIPMDSKILVMPYPTNPYRNEVKGSIILGYDDEFKNPDSGEEEKQPEGLIYAKVVEIGPDVKRTKIGDDVLCDSRTLYKVPFMQLGYRLTSEHQVLLMINEGLKERLGMTNGE